MMLRTKVVMVIMTKGIKLSNVKMTKLEVGFNEFKLFTAGDSAAKI